AINSSLGLDKPILVQYVDYHKGLFVGRTFHTAQGAPEPCPAPCLAYSFRTNEPVFDIVKRPFPVTLSVVLVGAILWTTTGDALGMFPALRKGSVFDKISIGFSLIGASMPVYVFAILAMVIVVFTLRWLSPPTYVSLFDNPVQFLVNMILPWATL